MPIASEDIDQNGLVIGVSPERFREVAMPLLFDHLNAQCEGTIAVNRQARIVWINDKYAEKVGIHDPLSVLGKEIEEVLPASRLREVVQNGQPSMLDLMAFGDEHFVVTRIPLRDEDGTLVGALGFVLFDRARHLQPVMAKYNQLQTQLAATQRELARARRARYTIAGFIGASAAASEVKRQARRAAQLDATVLLRGETAPGAFTGADRRGRAGKFELADGGTLFLDEIGDLPLPLQAKMLRVLQEQEVEPLGSNQVKALNVRVIAATHVDLEAKVAAGQFREDLYYRLNVLALRLPPLRERREDLPALIEHLLDDIASRSGQPPQELAEDALQLLQAQPWPGNVRELRNLLERAQLLSDSGPLGTNALRPLLVDPLPAATATTAPIPIPAPEMAEVLPLADSVAAAERQAILSALAACNGNRTQAAERLGIARASLYNKLQVHGI
jgi:transcriptional regulator with PAS, ATPase and Fis domain